MTKLYDGQIAELFSNGAKYNPEVQALSYALHLEKQRIMDRANETRTMAVIDALPEAILDVLAVELRTPAYNGNLPIETKRTLIKGTLAFYKKLGTPEAVNWVVRSIFGNGEIQEWFDYGGEPHHFRVSVKNDGTFTSIESISDFLRLVASVKRLSSWLDTIIIVTDLGEATIRVGGLMATITRIAIPAIADIFSFEDTVYTGGVMAASYRHQLPEIVDVFSFHSYLRAGGLMAAKQRFPVPAVDNDITLTSTGRIGVRGAVAVSVPMPEITQ